MHRMISATLLLLSFLSFSAICQAVEFTDCGSTVGKFQSVSVSGCDMTKAACDLVRETNATISIEFTTEKEVTQVTAHVHGIVMDVPVPFPLPNANACENPKSGLTCPLPQGGPYHYSATLPILKAYPKLSVVVKWELKDLDNQNIVCVYIPTKIK